MRRRRVVVYVTVCKNTVLSNLKNGTNEPPLRMSMGKRGKPSYHHKLEFRGPFTAKVVYAPKRPLPWGARAWVEIA